jgi:hypothetical protein
MAKKSILTAMILVAVLLSAQKVHAQENCVQVYGGGVVCGVQAPEHEPVDADLGDINPVILGSGLLSASVILFYIFKRRQRRVFEIK